MINGAVNDARALDIRYIIILFFFLFGLLIQIFLQSLCSISDAEWPIWQQFFFWVVNQRLIFILPDQEGAGQHWKIHGAPEPHKTGRLNWEHDGKYKVVKSTTLVAVSNHGQIALRELHSYTYKELSSSIFQSLSVFVYVTWPDLPFFQYIKAKMPSPDPVTSITATYWLSTTK